MTTGLQLTEKAAAVVKQWSELRARDGRTIAETCMFCGLSAWDIVAPTLAAFVLPKELADSGLSWRRRLKPYLALAKERWRERRWFEKGGSPPRAARGTQTVLVLAFSTYMFRDVLQPVVEQFAEHTDLTIVGIHDSNWLQPGTEVGKTTGLTSVWDYWDEHIAQQCVALKTSLARLWRQFRADALLDAMLDEQIEGNTDRLRPMLQWLFTVYMRRLLPEIAVAREVFKACRPSLVLSADGSDPRARVYYLLAKQQSVPSLEVQFGQCGRESVEWQFSVADRIAVWGAEAKEVLEGHGLPPERIEITGSPRWDGVMVQATEIRDQVRRDRRFPADRKLLLFASLYGLGAYDQFGDFVRTLKAVKRAIFEEVDRSKGVSLIVKPHPLEDMRETVGLARGLKNIEFVDAKMDIRELIPACDAFLTLGSTSTMDALVAGKPIIFPAFPGLVWWEDRFLTSGAVFVASARGQLAELLAALATDGLASASRELETARTRFLERTAYRIDGMAASRVQEIALRLARRGASAHIEGALRN
jgi:hypothetical protein